MISKSDFDKLISFNSKINEFSNIISGIDSNIHWLDNIIEHLQNQFDNHPFEVGDNVEIIDLPNIYLDRWAPHMRDMISLNICKGYQFRICDIILDDEPMVDLLSEYSLHKNLEGEIIKNYNVIIYSRFPASYLKII